MKLVPDQTIAVVVAVEGGLVADHAIRKCFLYIQSGDVMSKRRFKFIYILPIIFIINLLLTSCMEKGVVISKPDEFTHIFEASDTIVMRSIALVYKEKGLGDATINPEKNQVESDYVIKDEWRSKTTARVKKINWKECEVTLSVMTEKKTAKGWELRRLLEKRQYDKLFNAIDLQIYQELYKVKEGRVSP
jgi:hypothetical protein